MSYFMAIPQAEMHRTGKERRSGMGAGVFARRAIGLEQGGLAFYFTLTLPVHLIGNVFNGRAT